MIAIIITTYVLLLSTISLKFIVAHMTCAPSATTFFLDHLLSDFINFTIL